MQTRQILKLHALSLAAFAIFFVVACLVAHEDCERHFFEQSIATHNGIARLIDSSAQGAANGNNFAGDYFANSKDSLVAFYLRDKLSLIQAYIDMVRTQTSTPQPQSQGAAQSPEHVKFDNNSALTGLDVMYVTFDGQDYITTSDSRFLLDLHDDNSHSVRTILQNLPSDGREQLLHLSSADGDYYALVSAGKKQSVMVAVQSTRRILNLDLSGTRDEQFINNYITQLLTIITAGQHLEYALYTPDRGFTPALGHEISVNDKALQLALENGQYDYVHTRRLHAYAVTIYQLRALEACLVLVSSMDSMQERFWDGILKLGLIMGAVYVVYCAVSWYVMKGLTLSLRQEFAQLDVAIKDFERLNFTDKNDRLKAVAELAQLRARQHTPEAEHFGITLSNILEKMLSHYDEFIHASLKKAICRGEHNVYRSLKQDFLPTPDTIPNSAYLDIATYLDNATDIAGNFYNILKLDEDNIAIILGDTGARAHPAIQRLFIVFPLIEKHLKQGLSPAKVMMILNKEICSEFQECAGLTLLIAILNEKTGNFILANAGMPLPVLATASETEDLLNAEAQAPLGANPEMEYKQSKGILVQNDTLLLSSHGLEKTLDPQGNTYSHERLRLLLKDHAQQAVDQILLEIYKDLARFTERGELREDVTVLCLKQKSIRF